MSRVLPDTYYAYMLADPDNPVLVSAVSSWELRLKSAAIRQRREGSFEMPFSVAQAVRIMRRQRVKSVHLSVSHASQELQIPLKNRDPFDELLLVQAQEEELRFLTVDKALIDHPLAINL